MTQKINKRKAILRRLFPLYITAFLQSFVLWYAVEKLFMRQIGFNDAGIGLAVSLYLCVVLLLEIPSGILADRTSRKWMLIIGGGFLALSGFVGGMSTEPILYIVAALIWGVFDALYTGMYDSIVYDTVYEETGKSGGYEFYAGRVQLVESVGLIAGALLGGLVGQFFNLQAAYFLTIPLALCSGVSLLFFKEPQLHKASAEKQGSVKSHVKETFKALATKGAMLRLLIVVVLATVMLQVLYEFSALWLIATHTQAFLFGPGFAIAVLGYGLGGVVAGMAHKHRRIITISAFIGLLASSLVLATPTPLAVILCAQLFLGCSATILEILAMRDLHDLLPSHIRAGASSTVTTITRVILIPLGIAFGLLSTHIDIFAASWILVILALLAGAGEVKDWFGKRVAG